MTYFLWLQVILWAWKNFRLGTQRWKSLPKDFWAERLHPEQIIWSQLGLNSRTTLSRDHQGRLPFTTKCKYRTFYSQIFNIIYVTLRFQSSKSYQNHNISFKKVEWSDSTFLTNTHKILYLSTSKASHIKRGNKRKIAQFVEK